jgi:hypothetical protein
MEDDGYGWKLFAGIMILIAGTFNVIDGLVGLTQTSYYKSLVSEKGGQLPVTDNIKTWSWVILIIGAVMILAGFLIFVGNMFGRIVGILAASVNLLAQLAYVNHNTFASIMIILVDVLIIYGLVAHGGRLQDDWSGTT